MISNEHLSRSFTARSLALLLTSVVSFGVSHALAADAENGKTLYHEVELERTIRGIEYTDANCETCHAPQFYSREDRKVTSYAKLEAFIEGCNTNLDVGWFPDEVADVSVYMNEEFYHFEE
ncbi:hypothetical protein [uncultured Neptuniibacter sp.]|uniref:hypothetical protein n=1 Tax=uncultured Neptuniibacter sp. TaxID=502143 RepID=UPI002629C008|nr:hypothetical protein [uncultured Neptuniibacter sp.]